MATPKPVNVQPKPAKPGKPAPGEKVTTPPPVEQTECDPLPAKKSKGETNKPACPEGYPDRQPTHPPPEDPEQRSH